MLTIKNLTKEILKNKVFLILLGLMTLFTAFLFFFIRFSIDANMANLNSLPTLNDNQQNYMNALKSNTMLSVVMLIIFTIATALLFVMFYFRIFNSTKKQLGLLKTLGITNFKIQLYFTVFAGIFSVIGLLLGMFIGYFGSSIPMANNARSYDVSALIKGVSTGSVLLGLLLPIGTCALVTFFCGFNLYGKENAALLSDIKESQKPSKVLNLADKIVRKLPIKNKASLRIALRKPFSILLIVVASTVFTVMLVLGWSLTESSETVYKTQTDGHNYKYEAIFEQYKVERNNENALHYLSVDGVVIFNGKEVDQLIFGMDTNSDIYMLKNMNGTVLGLPDENECYVSAGFFEMYSAHVGDIVKIKIGDIEFDLTITDVAYNAKSKTLIVSQEYLASKLGLVSSSYNGSLSIDNLYPEADNVITAKMRIDTLERDKVTSAASAIINNVIGIVSGIILIFLALFITFQDTQKDMLIMDNLGYKSREIKKLLINVFFPILTLGFIIMVYPAILIAKGVQTGLALAMGDYMPFSTNIWVILVGFVVIVSIYLLTQYSFLFGIKYITKKRGILEYTNSL